MKTLLRFFNLLISFFLLNFLQVENCSAQSFNNSQLVTKAWTRIDGNPSDTLNITNQTLDKNKDLLTIGNTVSGSIDMLLTKYNGSTGSIIWQKQYNNSNHNDYGVAVVTDTNNYVYAATTSYVSSTNGYDWVIQKYKPNGFLQWTVTFNSGLYDAPVDMKYDNAGYLYVTGIRTTVSTLADYCTIKFNASNGSQVWSSPSYYDYASLLDIAAAITTVTSTKIAVVGASASSANNYDIASVLYNKSTGAQLSVTRSASNGLGFDQATAVAKDQYDNIYVTGSAQVSGNGADIKIVKLDTALNTVWSVTWDGDQLADGANSIGVDGYGFIYVTGSTKKINGGSDYITLKYKNNGTLQWAKRYSAPDTTKSAIAKKLDIDPYGNILIVGDIDNISNRDILTLAYDTGGNKIWEDWYIGSGDDLATSILLQDGTKTFYVTGKTWVDTGFQYLTIKYSMVDYITPPDTETCPFSFAYFENKGQIMGTNDTLQSQIKYYTLHHYPNIYFADDRQSFVFAHIDTVVATDDTLHRIDLTFQNGFTTKVSNAWERAPGYLNYFKPWCPAGVTPVHGYQRLLYPEVYRNTDFMVYANGAGIKYYFIVKPGGNPSNIIMKFTGADTVQILSDSTLEIISSIGSLTFEAPTAFQIDTDYNIINLNSPIAYSTAGANKIDFDYPSYNNTKPLIIEMRRNPPESTERSVCDGNICWSTYVGGAEQGNSEGLDGATDVTTDGSGNVYMCGKAADGLFPTTAGVFQSAFGGGVSDAFVGKFDNTDEQKWMSFLGGSGFSTENEGAFAVRIEPNGEVIIAGSTVANNFPTQDYSASPNDYINSTFGNNMYPRNGFIASISPAGDSLLWSTFLENFGGGGTLAANVYGLAIDKNGNIYAVGQSAAATYTYPNGAYHQQVTGANGTIVMFNQSKEVVWSTEFGADQYYGAYPFTYRPNTIIYRAVIDLDTNLYVCGSTRPLTSQNNSCSAPTLNTGAFPVCNAMGASFYQTNTDSFSVDGFIAKFNSHHQLIWSTMFRGSDTDVVYHIDVRNDKIYLTGYTHSSVYDTTGTGTSPNFPIRHPNFQTSLIGTYNAFVTVFSTAGTLQYSTYLGKSNGAVGYGITAHSSGNYFVTGATRSADFYNIGYNNYYAHNNVGDDDIFVSGFNSNNQMYWSTCIGSSGFDLGVSDVVTNNNQLYVVGQSRAENFPVIIDNPTDYNQLYGNCIPGNLGCPGAGDAIIIRAIVDPNFVEINEVEDNKNELQIFPNPTEDEFTVIVPSGYESLKLFNELGEIIKTIILRNSSTQETIRLNNIPKGIYLMRATDNSSSITKKIIIQ